MTHKNKEALEQVLEDLIQQQELMLAQQQEMLEQFKKLQQVLLGDEILEEEQGDAEVSSVEGTDQNEAPEKVNSEEDLSIFYSVAPKNGFFFGRQLSQEFIARQHIYRIEIVDEERAFYYLVEDAATRQHAFNIPDNYILPAIEVDGVGRLSEASEIEIEKGTLKKVGNNWQIVDKGILIMNK